MKSSATRPVSILAFAVLLFFSLGVAASRRTGPAQQSMKMKMNSKTVYVCSCMKTKSCPCMTEAKMGGKCACGAKAPDMKAVPSNSAWARDNRKALAGPTPMKMKKMKM